VTVDARVLVVGGGITGLAAAHRLAELGAGPDAVLVEREPHLGGKIATEWVDGFVVEGGPDCFLASKPAGTALCQALGIGERLVGTDPRFQRSYVKRGGRLHELPEGITGLVPSRIRPLLTTRMLSVPGRLRAGLEPFVPASRRTGDESIARFVSRRFGAEAYHWLVEPLLSGIYAGDGAALSLEATFPQLKEIERTHGSIVRMMLKQRGQRGQEGQTGPRHGFITLSGGLGELVQALERRLPPGVVRCGVAVEDLRPTDGAWNAKLTDGRTLVTRAVVLATPALVTADLVRGFDPLLAAALWEIPFVSTATVSVAFSRAAVPCAFDGYGYVSPRAEGGPVVACTWTSNKFPARAPGDAVLLRLFLGRQGDEGIAQGDDEAVREVVRRELHAVFGIAAEPAFWRIFRWPRAIPQYTLGHGERLARIEARLAELPGLHLAGCSYRGVGIPDCIESGRAAAERAVKR
jgi:oxygen-dependent protoporphyrinogen oxidase